MPGAVVENVGAIGTERVLHDRVSGGGVLIWALADGILSARVASVGVRSFADAAGSRLAAGGRWTASISARRSEAPAR